MVEETRSLLDRGYGRELGSMKGLGYRHISAFLANECDDKEMVRVFKRDTRRFAKRQMTWFRKEPGVEWFLIDEGEPLEHVGSRVIARIEEFLKGRGLQQQPIG